MPKQCRSNVSDILNTRRLDEQAPRRERVILGLGAAFFLGMSVWAALITFLWHQRLSALLAAASLMFVFLGLRCSVTPGMRGYLWTMAIWAGLAFVVAIAAVLRLT